MTAATLPMNHRLVLCNVPGRPRTQSDGQKKEEKQQQKQPLPMARATECSKLPSLYVGLRPTVAQLRREGKERCPAREDNGGRDL